MKIQLKPSCIIGVPLTNCDEAFTFIINGQKYETSRIIANLILPRVGPIQLIDPTIKEYVINTNQKGNFQIILDLITFIPVTIPDSEILFIEEIAKQLDNKHIQIKKDPKENITKKNVISLIQKHEKFPFLYSQNLQKEIDFAAESFHFLDKQQKQEILDLSIETIERILLNKQLLVESEDQVLSLVNKLYIKNKENAFLYEHVIFANVSPAKMIKFFNIFDFNDIDAGLWDKLKERMCKNIVRDANYNAYNRYYYGNTLDLIKSGKVKIIQQPPPPPPPPPPPLSQQSSSDSESPYGDSWSF